MPDVHVDRSRRKPDVPVRNRGVAPRDAAGLNGKVDETPLRHNRTFRSSPRKPMLPNRPAPRAPALFLLVALSACTAPGNGAEAPGGEAGAPPTSGPAEASAPTGNLQGVRPGIDVLLSDSLHLVTGRRVGLVTNHTGIDAEGRASIDRLAEHPQVDLVALFSPEHGIRGSAEAGVLIDDDMDPSTGLPIHSLYGGTLRPTPQMLEGLDVLLFDIQDIGTRYYTYVYTMAYAMEAAGEHGIPFVVLDRPNPVGGIHVQGNVLDPAYASFVGLFPLPMRHGMTPGELARLYRAEFGIEAELHLVPLEGWRREMLFPDTGLPWRAPSPNMPDVESALHYPGTCLFEGTNLSVGRGTDRPFQWVGAPWLDGDALASALTALEIPGVAFHPVRFTPRDPGDGKYDGVELGGVRLEVTDPDLYDPARAGVALLVESRRLAGDRWEWRSDHFDRLAGTQRLRIGVEDGAGMEEIIQGWAEELAEFERIRRSALVYP